MFSFTPFVNATACVALHYLFLDSVFLVVRPRLYRGNKREVFVTKL
jgi:hypothetical protein